MADAAPPTNFGLIPIPFNTSSPEHARGSESIRHAGHADILREGLDGRTGSFARFEKPIDEEDRAAYCAKIEQAARTATRSKA